uniref:hypothetical protein n=1 Tax=Clostridium sp. NkU-1 TaxID=1095009 RepID=UPI0032618729
MEVKSKDLWVFIETKEDGSAKKVGLELLNPGKDMAGKQGGSLLPSLLAIMSTRLLKPYLHTVPIKSLWSREKNIRITLRMHTPLL